MMASEGTGNVKSHTVAQSTPASASEPSFCLNTASRYENPLAQKGVISYIDFRIEKSGTHDSNSKFVRECLASHWQHMRRNFSLDVF